jgi:hypothetical protein
VENDLKEALRKNKNPAISRENDFYPRDEPRPEQARLKNPQLLERRPGGLFVTFSPHLLPIDDLFLTKEIIFSKNPPEGHVAAESLARDVPKESVSKETSSKDKTTTDDKSDSPDNPEDLSSPEKDATVAASYMGIYKGERLFFLATDDEELLKLPYIELVKDARRELSLPSYPTLPGFSLFMDPAQGWLTEVAGPRGPAGRFRELPRDALPDPGLSFISSARSEWCDATLTLLKNLPPGEKVLVVTEDLSLLLAIRDGLSGEKLAASCFYPHLEAVEAIYPFSLLKLMDKEREKWEGELSELAKEELRLKKEEETLRSDYQTHRSLNSLENNLRALKDEVENREKDWLDMEMGHSLALQQWQELQGSLKSGPPGLLSIFGSKKKEKENQEREKRAREKLELAERALGNARREKEDFVREAKGLREELLMVRAKQESLPPVEAISEKLKKVEADITNLALNLSSLKHKLRFSHSLKKERDHLEAYSVYLARPDYRTNSSLPQDMVFDNIIHIGPKLWTHSERKKFLNLSHFASMRFMVVSDFSLISFQGEAVNPEGELPWRAYLASKELPQAKLAKYPLLSAIKPTHILEGADGAPDILPKPEEVPELEGLKVQEGLLFCPSPSHPGLSLRGHSEMGPLNPVSALCAIKLAEQCLKAKVPKVIVLAPSPSQGRLLRSLAMDLKLEKEALLCGQVEDFDGSPPAPVVIVDSAFGPPHTGHPWARGETGAKFILQALSLAQGALVLLGSEERLMTLPRMGPLNSLYKTTSARIYQETRLGSANYTFPDIIDQAKESIFCVLPPMEPLWWNQLSPRFQSALRRRVKVLVISDLPPEDNRDYPGSAIRELRIAGAMVLLGQGFSAFTAIIDKKVFAYGFLDNQPGLRAWKGFSSINIPLGAPLILNMAQLPLILKKLGPSAFRNCPSCGWPYLLINQDRTRGFGDLNSLKLGCLNESCPIHKKPRPLDERWPFLSPPTCKVDGETPYQRMEEGRHSYWVCPKHPDHCPRHRVIPGDPK